MTKHESSRPFGLSLPVIAIVIVAGAVLAPVAVYVFGANLIAPYEGDGGLLGFLGSVYGDALRGKLAAWALLLSPALFVLTWWAVLRLARTADSAPKPGH